MSSPPEVIDLEMDAASVDQSELLSKHLGGFGDRCSQNPSLERALDIMTRPSLQRQRVEPTRSSHKVPEAPVPMTFQVSAGLQKFMVQKNKDFDTWLC